MKEWALCTYVVGWCVTAPLLALPQPCIAFLQHKDNTTPLNPNPLSHRGFRVIKNETKEFVFDKPGVCAIAAPRVYQSVA